MSSKIFTLTLASKNPRRLPEGTLVRIVMDEPLDMARFPFGHPWELNGGWPPYKTFEVSKASCSSQDCTWSYCGPDGASWHEDHLELVNPMTPEEALQKKLDKRL